MPYWTKEQKADYLAKVVKEAIKEDRDIREAILEALKKIEKDEKDLGAGI